MKNIPDTQTQLLEGNEQVPQVVSKPEKHRLRMCLENSLSLKKVRQRKCTQELSFYIVHMIFIIGLVVGHVGNIPSHGAVHMQLRDFFGRSETGIRTKLLMTRPNFQTTLSTHRFDS